MLVYPVRFVRGLAHISPFIQRDMTDKTKRIAPTSYRPPAQLQEEFTARVERSGLSKNAFITKSIFNDQTALGTRHAVAQEKDIVRLLTKCASLKTTLDKIEDRSVVTAAYADLYELRAACFKLLGRKP